ncbi:hypothetical protein BGZ61DRAFT_500668 [Ilyonectria robusta]|uniref:uncharacterized protein n=1 Tax=Ilyonectria robusta TaxID=1079257 RepID=UPI001E8EDB3A|nr:uncharacterized protein BGZ61DRAFT_500668 [Ilyonectria robusta]KAH8654181.1 hypothetical protein BGZ61DRAFT_500668 [Ilyonectria robusta]
MMTKAKTQPKANLNGLGIFWITFALSWTFIVAGGMIFLWRRRDMPILRIRGLPLSSLAITLLHLYWGAVQTGYVYFRLTTPEVEYCIMSIYLPCGIALFHASNSRFLHVAKAQKELFASDAASINSKRAKAKSLIGRFRSLNYTRKILILVGAGMSCQFFLTVFMYLISRKWPSVFWQFFWAWIVALYILWTQTIACCLLSLHATPMWLIALYVPAMSVVNRVWVPPQWIAISILMLEIFTIFFPCWETLDSINQWQLNKSVGKTSGSIPTGSTKVAGSSLTVWSKGDSIENSVGESILTMEALECKFSALRDFSGENIAFLRAVAEWQSSLPLAVLDPEKIKDDVAQELVRERFNSALRIYINFVSSHHAKFQINLSSQDLKRLASVFEPSARILYGEKHEIDPATPFDSFEMTSKVKSSSGSCRGSETGNMTGSINETEAIGDKALYWGDIPDGFDATIFHDAESSIKYLVFTNTWPKFVKDRQSSINSNGNLEAGNAIPATP